MTAATAARPDTWMPLYIGDYLGDTMHLTPEQHGVYLLLIMACWRRGGLLPKDEAQLAGTARLTLRRWRELLPIIAPFFIIGDDGWRNKRVNEELENAQKRINRASSGGTGKAAKQALSTPQAPDKQVLEACSTSAPLPSPSPKKKDSEAIASAPDGAVAEAIAFDTKAAVFGEQLAWLRENTGKTEAALRSWLGKCCGEYGEVETLAAILNIRSNPTPVDPISRMRSILERQGTRNGTGQAKLSAVEGIYAGFAIELGERERQADCRADSDPAQPLLDSRDVA